MSHTEVKSAGTGHEWSCCFTKVRREFTALSISYSKGGAQEMSICICIDEWVCRLICHHSVGVG